MLSVGRNTTLILRLLHYAAHYADPCVIHSSINNLTVSAIKDNDNNTWFEAGSFLRATGGICVVGDLSTIKKKNKRIIYEGVTLTFVLILNYLYQNNLKILIE